MFGQHLLRQVNRDTRVFIVEGEKNAIFGSLMYPQGIWLAVGSAQEIGKVRKVKNILAGCKSVVFVPDADAISDWTEYIEKFRLPNATVNRFCGGHSDGYDIADYAYYSWLSNPHVFFRQEATPEQPAIETPAPYKEEKAQVLADMIAKNPAIGLLVEKFNLELVA